MREEKMPKKWRRYRLVERCAAQLSNRYLRQRRQEVAVAARTGAVRGRHRAGRTYMTLKRWSCFSLCSSRSPGTRPARTTTARRRAGRSAALCARPSCACIRRAAAPGRHGKRAAWPAGGWDRRWLCLTRRRRRTLLTVVSVGGRGGCGSGRAAAAGRRPRRPPARHHATGHGFAAHPGARAGEPAPRRTPSRPTRPAPGAIQVGALQPRRQPRATVERRSCHARCRHRHTAGRTADRTQSQPSSLPPLAVVDVSHWRTSACRRQGAECDKKRQDKQRVQSRLARRRQCCGGRAAAVCGVAQDMPARCRLATSARQTLCRSSRVQSCGAAGAAHPAAPHDCSTPGVLSVAAVRWRTPITRTGRLVPESLLGAGRRPAVPVLGVSRGAAAGCAAAGLSSIVPLDRAAGGRVRASGM